MKIFSLLFWLAAIGLSVLLGGLVMLLGALLTARKGREDATGFHEEEED